MSALHKEKKKGVNVASFSVLRRYLRNNPQIT